MTPIQRCLHEVDHAAWSGPAPVAASIHAALNELESAFRLPGERVIALEAVYQEFSHRGRVAVESRVGRFLLIAIDRRQNCLAHGLR